MSNYNTISLINQNGSKIWETTITSNGYGFLSALVAKDGKLYVGGLKGLYSLYEDSGEQDWYIGLFQGIALVNSIKINSEGNLILLSRDRNQISCVKGD